MAGDGLGWLGGALGGLGSIIGAGINSATQSKINKENIAMQKEFAQNSIQWKVADAKKAGIHPAIGLGSQPYQATPSSVAPDVGSGVAGAFKHFGSAIDSFIEDKSEERQLQLESLKLDNEAKRQEIAKMKNASGGNVLKEFNNGNPFIPPSPAPTVSNEPPKQEKKPPILPLNKALKLDAAFTASPTLDGKGIKISINPESVEGQSMSEGVLQNIWYSTRAWYKIEKAVSNLENNAREAGILPNGYHFVTSYVEGGVELYPEKDVPKKDDMASLEKREKKQKRYHNLGNRGLW